MRIHAEEALPEVSAGAPLESGATKLDVAPEAWRLPCGSILSESQLVSSKLLTFVAGPMRGVDMGVNLQNGAI